MKTNQLPISIRSFFLRLCLIFTIPSLFLLTILGFYTIHRQIEDDFVTNSHTLSIYSTQMSQTISRTEQQLAYVITNNSYFQSFNYSGSKTEAYLNAYELQQQLKPLLVQDPLIGGFFLYHPDYSFYYPCYQLLYDYQDQLYLKNFLLEYSTSHHEKQVWMALDFSDRRILLRVACFDKGIIAMMIDPSLDENILQANKNDAQQYFFYASTEGVPYFGKEKVTDFPSKLLEAEVSSINISGKKYEYYLSDASFEGGPDIQLILLTPYLGIWAHLNAFQRILLSLIIALLILYPLIGEYFSKKMLPALSMLTDTARQIQKGNLSLRISEEIPVLEFKLYSQVFNQMLDSIERMKLEAYEQKLDLQQAQLQYLHLQIRPHFYLNCLKGLYGLLQKEHTQTAKDMILSLSDYIRYIFRDNRTQVTLMEELSFISSYLNIQKLNFNRDPKLDLSISANATEQKILPLTLLTFVENSIKHSPHIENLCLSIHATCMSSEDGNFLHLVIKDNNGGFSEQALHVLNDIPAHKSLYEDYHIGISNIYYRMSLAYDHHAWMIFYNQGEYGCAELFIPVATETKEK